LYSLAENLLCAANLLAKCIWCHFQFAVVVVVAAAGTTLSFESVAFCRDLQTVLEWSALILDLCCESDCSARLTKTTTTMSESMSEQIGPTTLT
jgi:hypothetical protein